ncbi:helix-turn-helix transcriptional regulator [Mycolicibacterium sp. BiH015]|uniref:helix-turn-helix transcriptional regulator n=1 Tax=Mycolicibacterium sp. BiH015 TaxID=3018808 RepID=UPI0022E36F3E|nr:helix-turn-helix transcriptional regulator [Mycolicibacterium sp. BiH015]MDA2890682.1 helix-turn-helix transcriptional regulator [Mycolicibacterium sp. BiH015]
MAAILVDTKDPRKAKEVFADTYALQVSPLHCHQTKFHGRLQRSQVGSITIDDVVIGVDVGFQRRPSDRILLTRIHSGVVHAAQGDSSCDVFTEGDVAALGALTHHPVAGTSCGRAQHYTVVSIDRSILDAAAWSEAKGLHRVELLGQAPVSDEAGRRMAKAIDYATALAVADPAAATDPLVAASLQRHLAAMILTTFPLKRTHEGDNREGTPPPLAEAMTYIEEHVDADVTLASVAKAVHTSTRSLQLMFRKHCGCTPMQHLRDVRLQRAHADLLAAGPSSTSVSAVSMRWGFGHSGRFAARYRERFGESPSVTLQRSPRVDPPAEAAADPALP